MTKLTEWQRRVALDVAQAFPLTPSALIRATGQHRVAENDEPEPDEAARIAADLERDQNKGPKLAARNDAQALAAQIMDLDAMRRAGWL